MSILVIGDSMLDVYLNHVQTRRSPEADVPILRQCERRVAPGGAANVAMNVASLIGTAGPLTTLITSIAYDNNGLELRRSAHSSVDIEYLRMAERTTSKTRIIVDGAQIARIDDDVDLDRSEYVDSVLRRMIHRVSADKKPRVIIASDYGRGLINESSMKAIFDVKTKLGCLVFVDPKRKDWSIYSGADVITPNTAELLQAFNIPRSAMVVETMGRLGMMIRTPLADQTNGAELGAAHGAVHIPGVHCDAVDVTGAGDTMIASLGVEASRGMDVLSACRVANTAASIAVRCRGTIAVRASELNRLHKT